MSKNVIYFSLLLPSKSSKSRRSGIHDGIEYYAMLYTALSSLEPYQNDSFDVVVMYTCLDKEFDINTYVYNDKYNIIKDFPFVSFVESDYKKTDIHMHRWHNFSRIFEMGYDVAFYLDCNVVFFESPMFHFKKYSEENVMYAQYEGYFPLWEKVLNREGITSGKMILPRTVFSELKPNLHDRIMSTRKKLERKASKVLRKDDAKWFCALSEQFGAFETLQNYQYSRSSTSLLDYNYGITLDADRDENVVIKNLEHKDITFIGGGAEALFYNEWIQFKNNNGIISVEKSNLKILHYFDHLAYIFVSGGLHTPEMVKKYNEFQREWKIKLLSKSEDAINHLTNYIESCTKEEELYTIAYQMINLSRNIYDNNLNDTHREELLKILPGTKIQTTKFAF